MLVITMSCASEDEQSIKTRYIYILVATTHTTSIQWEKSLFYECVDSNTKTCVSPPPPSSPPPFHSQTVVDCATFYNAYVMNAFWIIFRKVAPMPQQCGAECK